MTKENLTILESLLYKSLIVKAQFEFLPLIFITRHFYLTNR